MCSFNYLLVGCLVYDMIDLTKILGNYAYQAYHYIETQESLSHTLICIYVYNALLYIPYHYLRLVDEIFGHSDHGHDCRLRTSFRGIGHGLAMAYPP